MATSRHVVSSLQACQKMSAPLLRLFDLVEAIDMVSPNV
jgi:SpoU rRNA methylase family enzyme